MPNEEIASVGNVVLRLTLKYTSLKVLDRRPSKTNSSGLIQDVVAPQQKLVIKQPTNTQAPFVKTRRKIDKLLPVLLLAVFLAGGSIALTGWHTNPIAKAHAVNKVSKQGTNPVPSTVRPLSAAIAAYSVPPTEPKYLIIPKLGVNARIRNVGLTRNGALGTPNNVYDTDWYNQSSLPGQPGAMLIDGHVSSWTTHGVFYGLKSLIIGDTIQVERGDTKLFTYKVVKTQVFNSNAVDMGAAMSPVNSNQPGLNLITCSGDIIPGTNEFSQRIMVFAEQI